MNRTDRLHAVTEELRRAGSRGRTGARLAEWLEVSTRTVKRNIAALQQAGLPIWAAAGPGGGYVLDRVANLPPVNLTAGQAVAIAAALAMHRDGPSAVDGRVALEKILNVMDPSSRDRADRLGRRVWVRDKSPGPTVATAVEQALAERRVLALSYCDGQGRPSRRRVEPHLIAHTNEHWYLLAWCLKREAPRWFRWDRIERAQVTAEPAPHRDLAVFGAPPPDARPVR